MLSLALGRQAVTLAMNMYKNSAQGRTWDWGRGLEMEDWELANRNIVGAEVVPGKGVDCENS